MEVQSFVLIRDRDNAEEFLVPVDNKDMDAFVKAFQDAQEDSEREDESIDEQLYKQLFHDNGTLGRWSKYLIRIGLQTTYPIRIAQCFNAT